MANNNIYPLAYKLSAGYTCTLYYLGFPMMWKESLLEIARKANSKFKDEYGLPTNALKKILDSWLEGIVSISPLKKGSHDAHWLTSCHKYTEKEIAVLCDMIKVWIKATYVENARVPASVKLLANDFCEQIQVKELAVLQSEAEACLTLEDGTVSDAAYQAIPLLAVNRLLGKELTLSSERLRLCYAAKNQLISLPITDHGTGHQYSFVFDFSVQTTPPKRKALLLCHMSIRRWIPDNVGMHMPFLKESIKACVCVFSSKYCQIPIAYDSKSKQIDWKAQDKECYNICGYERLPAATDVLQNPADFAAKILLPYKNGIAGFREPKIGTGVSMVDKASLFKSLSDLLGNIICDEQLVARRISSRGKNYSTLSSPEEYSSREAFRNWFSKCAETSQITFELYGLWNDLKQRAILEQIQKKIETDFGENTEGSCLEVYCLRKEIGSFADAMENDKTDTCIRRCDEVAALLEKADGVTACLVILPGSEHYEKVGDPKQVLRNAFARTGRVTQFITPDEEINQNKIDNAVYDLYRQVGVVALLNPEKEMPPLASVPCIGMHLITQVHGTAGKARFLPISVVVDFLNGKVRVHCDVFPNKVVSYREACLEMAQLFWKSDLEQRCVDASRSPAKQKLIELKNRYYASDDGVLLIVQSDGNTRALWSGISDKEVGGYTVTKNYCPTQINAGMPQNPYPISLAGSGVRIIRIRSNQEVPDYHTEYSEKMSEDNIQYASASGVFRFDDVYWGIHARPNDYQYLNSFKESRIDHPSHRYAEKDMIELYPLQLQPGDEADQWVLYTNALRKIPIQYNQSTVLPLPLHLARALEEYCFNV